MNVENISSLLTATTLGKNILLLPEADSTNAVAMRMAGEGTLKNGDVIIAERQTAGKGRFGRTWSSDGGLCMTVAIKTPETQNGFLTLSAGIGVAEGLKNATGGDFFLKYPNDIYSAKSNGKKLGGILAQASRGFVIIGIGVNITQDVFPEELLNKATSLKMLGLSTAKERAAGEILNSLEPWLNHVAAGNFGTIRERWLRLNCTIGNRVSIKDVAPQVDGTAIGLDEDGALLVDTKNGRTRVTGGEIT